MDITKLLSGGHLGDTDLSTNRAHQEEHAIPVFAPPPLMQGTDYSQPPSRPLSRVSRKDSISPKPANEQGHDVSRSQARPAAEEYTFSFLAAQDSLNNAFCYKCPNPGCGRVVKDLKAHMLTHTAERPYKCSIVDCAYHVKGFARKYDSCRHIITHFKGTLVCDFCPNSGTSQEKSFGRADVFKRHLTTVHGVEGHPPNSRKRSVTLRTTATSESGVAKCSTCPSTFRTAQEFYDHLDNCILKYLDEDEAGAGSHARHLKARNDDAEVKEILQRNSFSTEIMSTIPYQGYEENEDDSSQEFHRLTSNTPKEWMQSDPSYEYPSKLDQWNLKSLDNTSGSWIDLSAMEEYAKLSGFTSDCSSHVNNQKPGPIIQEQKIHLQELRSEVYTDSGYESMPRADQEPNQDLAAAVQGKLDNETCSVYSSTSSTDLGAKYSYVSAMASLLWNDLSRHYVGHAQFENISTTICTLLGQFAGRLGYHGSTDVHRRIMVFIHKHRREIVTTMKRLEQQQQHDCDEHETKSQDKIDEMTINEKMALWMSSEDKSVDNERPSHEAATVPKIDHEEDSDLAIYLESLVVKDPNYEWLVHRCRQAARYTLSETQSAMASTIIESVLDKRKVSRSDSLVVSRLLVHLGWDLEDFIQQQTTGKVELANEQMLSLDALENVITITGSSPDFEAVTCGSYLDRIWPKLGRKVLEAIQTALPKGKTEPAILQTGVSIQITIRRPDMDVQLEGSIHLIAEVVEILAWLSTALQPSKQDIVSCRPILERIVSDKAPCNSFKLRHVYEELKPLDNGSCWWKMFRNPMVVLDFPIQRRAQMPGLEIPMNIVCSLLCSRRINVFNGRLLLKSFSALVVPVSQTDDIIQWHYLYNNSGDYLDFTAADAISSESAVSEKDLQKRLVVGWCSAAKVIAGAPGPHYAIRRSRISKSISGIALKSFALSAGSQPGAMLEASVAVGIKDRPLHVSPAFLGIVDKLRWISERHVVLYDCEEKRGWLINGVNALLHLLRTSLEHYYTDKFNSALKLKPEQILEPKADYPDAAIDFFLQDELRNLQLELYTKRFDSSVETSNGIGVDTVFKFKKTSVLLQDRVEDLWDILAHVIHQQIDMSKRDGLHYKPHFRKTLDGWDFRNIATDRSTFEPVSATMDCFQQPWVDMVRTLNIPVLFGKGFGEIIQPVHTDTVCSQWSTLPKGENYLAATVATMKEIMERYGDDSVRPMKICKNILWFNTSEDYSACHCHGGKQKHIDNVQVLWPEGLRSKILRDKAANLPPNGAVVFGHNSEYSWFRNELGVALEGILRSCRLEENDAVQPKPTQQSMSTHSLTMGMDTNSENTQSNASTADSETNSGNVFSDATVSQQSDASTPLSLTYVNQPAISNSDDREGIVSDGRTQRKRKASFGWFSSNKTNDRR